MKTTKEQIRRRRRQRNLTTSWKLANEARRNAERKRDRREADGGREKLRGAKKRTKTRNEGRGNRLGGRTTTTTDLWHSRSLFHGFAEGEEAGLSLARKARLIPLHLGNVVIYRRSTTSRFCERAHISLPNYARSVSPRKVRFILP